MIGNNLKVTIEQGHADNLDFAKWRVQCFSGSLVQGSTFGIQMNFCAENPPFRKAEKRYLQAK